VSEDPYLDANGVLTNLLGITDSDHLRQAEADLSFAAMLRLAARPLSGDYDLTHLRAFHRALFGAVYPWAGRLRTVRLARTEHDMFCFPRFIESAAANVFERLARANHLRGLDRPTFARRLAYYHSEINAIHPFREGNGRTQWAFLGQLARDAGWHVAWARLGAETNDRASAAALHGDLSHLGTMVDGLISPSHPPTPGGADLIRESIDGLAGE
jgi:cell filamentation protein